MDDKDDALTKIRHRLAAASPSPWTVEKGADGVPYIRTARTDGENRLFVKLDDDPARDDDVAFIALARNVLPRLVSAVETGRPGSIPPPDLDRIDAAADKATAGPWIPFIEEEGGIAGPSIISVDGYNDAPDMYLRLGDAIAPGGDIAFVAHAREDVPRLVAEIRRRTAS